MAVTTAEPAELGALRERLAELTDIHGTMAVLSWDQNTYMPAGGHATRADQLATLERLAHGRLADPALGSLLDVLEPWAAAQDPSCDAVALVRWARRDHDKAARVPQPLAVAMARESAEGYAAWLRARETGEFSLFRDPLARQVELRHEYAACFDDVAHPYDVLLDDFEPGLTLAEIQPLFDTLIRGLEPLVERAEEVPDPLRGELGLDGQRELLTAVLAGVGFEPHSWRLDTAPHPFAQSPGAGDVRITTRYSPSDLGESLYSGLHEFGHGLYDANLGATLRRTPLHQCASLGIHESQSRLWENVIGRGRPFTAWLLPHLREHLPATYGDMDHATLYRGLNGVRRTLIRTEADETTYNLHVALRLELELGLLGGRLEAGDLPAAWAEGMHRLVGVDVPSDQMGVLQDVHWAIGSFGYFPTYTLGNLMAAQLWEQLRADLPEVDEQIERGDFAPVREWLRMHIHQHGRKFTQRELLRRATGQELAVEPFLAYLEAKLRDARIIS